MKRQEGMISVKGGRVWYEVVGSGKRTPLIVLHGGPGYPSDYLKPLEDLARNRQVIFYDQLGCGNSQRPTYKKLWTVKRFVQELGEVIKALKLKEYYLLGHSWGAALAVSFALTKSTRLKGLVLADSYLSTPVWEKDAKRLLSELPKNMEKVLTKGDPKSEAFKKASEEFYFRHVYRMKILPTAVLRAHNKMSNAIYNYMWGPEEFEATGTLKTYDETKNLYRIKVPVLLVCGRFDEATPESTEYFMNLFPNAKMHVFEKSSHMPHWTETKEYNKTVSHFLESIE